MASGSKLWSGALGLVLVTACGASPLTTEERQRLSELTLQAPPPDPTNRYADDPAAAALGHKFFFDARFSGPLTIADTGENGGLGPAGSSQRVSCASCHDPGRGGSDHRSLGNTSLGALWTGRNAPSVINAALYPTPWMFWDGRKDSLWSQALGPIESPGEHNFSRLEVAHLIGQLYRAEYEGIFGAFPDLSDASRFPAKGRPGDAAFDEMAPADKQVIDRVFANFGKSIAAYERRLVDSSSRFDRYMSGDESALTSQEVRGAKLFVGRASCNECHNTPAFSDGKFHNHAIPQLGPTVPQVDPGREVGISKVLADPFNGAGAFADQRRASHLAGLVATPRDLGAFKTPTLRNVSRTAPYMHTGAMATLWDVALWYRDAAGTDGFVGQRDPAVHPLQLTDADLNDLIAFLRSLDGDPIPAEWSAPPTLPSGSAGGAP